MSENIAINTVKSWIELDDKIHEHQRHLSLLKQEKKRITQNLLELMKTANTNCYQTKDCQIQLKVKKTKKVINNKDLLQFLKDYYPDDDETALDLNSFLLDRRENKVSTSIVRKDMG
jgi:uncharacterized protein (UPF0335 family)